MANYLPKDKIELTNDDYEQLKTMSGFGMPVDQMCAILDISKTTFNKLKNENDGTNAFARALIKGRSVVGNNVIKRAYELVMAGNVTMVIFWLKCRQHWSETSLPDNIEPLTYPEVE